MMILAVLSRIVIKFAVRRSLGIDDYTVCAALVRNARVAPSKCSPNIHFKERKDAEIC
jgi:hypothetical protein